MASLALSLLIMNTGSAQREGHLRQIGHPFFLSEHIHTKGSLGSVHINHEQRRERFCGLCPRGVAFI